MIDFEHITRVPVADEADIQPQSWDTQVDINTLHSLRDIFIQIPNGYGNGEVVSALEYFNLEQAWAICVASGMAHAFIYTNSRGSIRYEYVEKNKPVTRKLTHREGMHPIHVSQETAALIGWLLAHAPQVSHPFSVAHLQSATQAPQEQGQPVSVIETAPGENPLHQTLLDFSTRLVAVAAGQIEFNQSRDGTNTTITAPQLTEEHVQSLCTFFENSEIQNMVNKRTGKAENYLIEASTVKALLTILGAKQYRIEKIPATQMQLTINWDYRSKLGTGVRLVFRTR